jgi:hypothetical protein
MGFNQRGTREQILARQLALFVDRPKHSLPERERAQVIEVLARLLLEAAGVETREEARNEAS